MTGKFLLHEIVRSGNATARVKQFEVANNFIVLMDINGTIGVGSTITGDESGAEMTLISFDNESTNYDTYVYDPWTAIFPVAIVLDNGAWVALDTHFTGLESQDYQPDYVVVES